MKHLTVATHSTDAMTHHRICHSSVHSVAHWVNFKFLGGSTRSHKSIQVLSKSITSIITFYNTEENKKPVCWLLGQDMTNRITTEIEVRYRRREEGKGEGSRVKVRWDVHVWGRNQFSLMDHVMRDLGVGYLGRLEGVGHRCNKLLG